MFVFDLPVTSVLRWMGKDGFTYDEAIAALKDQKVSPMPREATIRSQLQTGKSDKPLSRGPMAELTKEQQKQLREAAKTVKSEETK